MLNPDSEARTDPLLLLTRPARATRGAERARQFQRRRRIATFGAVALFLMAFGIARAWAWTASVQPSTDCNGTTFNGTVGNEPGSHTATVEFGGETKTVTVPAQGGNSFTLHFASHDGGPWSYKGTWSETSEVERQRGNLPAMTDCQPTTTTAPPTTAPPVTTPAPPDDTPKLGPPDQHRAPPVVPPIEKAPPKEAKPPVQPPGQLPFTDNNRNGVLLVTGSSLLLAGVLLVLLVDGRRRYQRMLRSVAPNWGEVRVRPDRDSADTNLLTTCFHRFNR